MILSVAIIIFLGLPLGIAFTGGSIVNFSYDSPQQVEVVKQAFEATVGDTTLIEKGEGEYHATFQSVETDTQERIIEVLKEIDSSFNLEQFNSVGPHISGETGVKTIIALFAALVVVALFVTYAFASVSTVFPSWKYGVVALVTLIHDVIISVGIFSLVGYIYGFTIDLLFVTAMLAIIGYSINDTLVIFDRIRSYTKEKSAPFELIVWNGVKASVRRSVYTSLTTATPLLVISLTIPFVQWFAFALLLGVVVGTYSSLLFAPGLLIWWHKNTPLELKDEEESEVEKSGKSAYGTA